MSEKIKCNCPCHSDPNFKHVQPCCKGGYIEMPDFFGSTHPGIPMEDMQVIAQASDVWNEEIRPHFFKGMIRGYLLAKGKLPNIYKGLSTPTEGVSLPEEDVYARQLDFQIKMHKDEARRLADKNHYAEADQEWKISEGLNIAKEKYLSLSKPPSLPLEQVPENVKDWIEAVCNEIWNKERAIMEPGELAAKVALVVYEKMQAILSQKDHQIKSLEAKLAATLQSKDQAEAQLEEARHDGAVFKEWWEKGQKDIAALTDQLLNNNGKQ